MRILQKDGGIEKRQRSRYAYKTRGRAANWKTVKDCKEHTWVRTMDAV